MATGQAADEAGVEQPLVADEAGGNSSSAPPLPETEAATATTRSRRAAAIASFYSWLTHLSMFSLCGVLTVFALRLFGPPVLYFCALIMALLVVLAYFGYLNLNWRDVASRGARMGVMVLDADGDGRLTAGDACILVGRAYNLCVSFGGTALAGYALGLWLGVRMF